MVRERMAGPAMTTRLGDGCRHVFLDVGSNRGVHVLFLTEPHLFPNSSFLARGFFASYFGPHFATDPAVCAFGFEPNAAHAERLDRLARLYRSAGRRVEFFQVAAQAEAGAITMYNHRGDDAESDWRFGTKRLSYRPVNVSAVDLSTFIQREIVGRTIPAEPATSRFPPSVVMKMDVEGDELSLFERMLETRSICALDLVTWEIHKAQLSAREMSYRTHARLWGWVFEHERPEDEDELQAPRLAVLRAEWEARRGRKGRGAAGAGRSGGRASSGTADGGTSCRTRLAATDDESYLMVPDVPRRAWEPGR